jgi:hypothetical protein
VTCWFQTFAFKCNVYRYIEGKGRNGLARSVTVEVTLSPKEEGEYEAVGAVQVEIQLTHSLKARGFNP